MLKKLFSVLLASTVMASSFVAIAEVENKTTTGNMPMVDTTSMEKSTPSITWSQGEPNYANGKGVLKDVKTKDFVLRYTFYPESLDSAGKYGIYYGITDDFATNNVATYIGRAGYLDDGGAKTGMYSIFADDYPSTVSTDSWWLDSGTEQLNNIDMMTCYNKVDIYLSYVNGTVTYGIKPNTADDTQWVWYQETDENYASKKAGGIAINQGGVKGGYFNVELYTPEQLKVTTDKEKYHIYKGTEVKLTFNENINEFSYVYLNDGVNDAIEAEVYAGDNDKEFTFTFPQELSANTEYTVDLSGFVDVQGRTADKITIKTDKGPMPMVDTTSVGYEKLDTVESWDGSVNSDNKPSGEFNDYVKKTDLVNVSDFVATFDMDITKTGSDSYNYFYLNTGKEYVRFFVNGVWGNSIAVTESTDWNQTNLGKVAKDEFTWDATLETDYTIYVEKIGTTMRLGVKKIGEEEYLDYWTFTGLTANDVTSTFGFGKNGVLGSVTNLSVYAPARLKATIDKTAYNIYAGTQIILTFNEVIKTAPETINLVNGNTSVACAVTKGENEYTYIATVGEQLTANTTYTVDLSEFVDVRNRTPLTDITIATDKGPMPQISDETLAGMTKTTPVVKWYDEQGTEQPGEKWSATNNGKGYLDGINTKNFVLKYTVNAYVQHEYGRFGVYYGTKDGFDKHNPKSFAGTVGYIRPYNGCMSACFSQNFPTGDNQYGYNVTYTTYGGKWYNITDVLDLANGQSKSVDVYVSYIDGELVYGIKPHYEADGVTETSDKAYDWYREKNTVDFEAGGIVIVHDGMSGEYSNMELYYVPEKVENVEFTKTSTETTDTITATAYVEADATLLTAVYEKSGDEWVFTSVSMDSAKDEDGNLESSVTVPNDSKVYKVKAMVWDSLSSMTPIFATEEYIRGTVDSAYVVWPGYTSKAVTFSYDDGSVGDDNQFIEILDANNLEGTFNIYTNYTNLDTRYSQKHEIGNHIYDHPNLGNTTTYPTIAEVMVPIDEGKAQIEKNSSHEVRGLVWPGSAPSSRADYNEILSVLEDRGYIYARNSGSSYSFSIPTDWMKWNCTTHHNYAASYWASFKALEQTEALQLFSIWGHSHEFKDDDADTDATTSWTEITNLCREIGAATDIYSATNKDIVAYANAAKKFTFTETTITNHSDLDLYVIVNGEQKLLPSGTTMTIEN